MAKINEVNRPFIMSKIKSRDTSPELNLRRALYRMGLRYRVQFGPEKIDIAIPGKKIAVFVDGCFWHRCPLHGHLPESNLSYWLPKFKKNEARSALKDKQLEEAGWKVVHIWEHDLKDPTSCWRVAESIIELVNKPCGVKKVNIRA